MSDVEAQLRENLADFRQLVAGLEAEQWDADSLCAGWRVRDVIGHIVVGCRVPKRTVVAQLVRGGFDVAAIVKYASRTMGDRSIAELGHDFEKETSRSKLRGMAGITPPTILLPDTLTHMYDIAVPLEIDLEIPQSRLVSVLGLLPSTRRWGSKNRAKGLRLIATDIDWSHGSGPEVRGSARALILSLGGRRQLAHTLAGDGADTLRARVAA